MDTEHIDRALADLRGAKDRWAGLPLTDKIELLRGIRERTIEHARGWVERAVAAKGLSMDSPLAGEEWLAGPYGLIDMVNTLERTLTRVRDGVDVLDGYRVHRRPDGRVVVTVLPVTATDRLLFSGSTVEVWMEPDVSIDELHETTAGIYRGDPPSGSVCVILGAGNVASIPPLDLLYKLFNEGRVAVLKMNPVNDYLGETFEAIFEEFIAGGYVRLVYGGGDVGAYLTTHPDVDTIHITGSAATYNAIRYGTGPEGEANRVADRPINDRPISAELGGVSPTIVVPGDWSRADLRFQAENVVTQKMNNSGFNCIAAQVLVLPDAWELTDAFVDEIRSVLAELDDRAPYYPGARERCEAIATGSGKVESFGGGVGRLLITGLDPSDRDEPAFVGEFFAPALAVVTLPGIDVPAYMEAATAFANDVLEGSLGANVIVHPRTRAAFPEAFDRMISSLRYGGIGVNVWSGFVYLTSTCPWGAFPGNTPDAVGSGIGFVHNGLMLDRPQKSIATGPFAPSPRTLRTGEFHLAPKPIWFVTNRRMADAGEHFVEYIGSGSTAAMMKVLGAALRG